MTHILFQDSDIMVEKPHLRVPRWLKFVSPMSFIVVLFILVVSYQSFFDTHPPPIETGAASAMGRSGRLATLVVYTRSVTVNEDVNATISRQLNCAGFPAYDFPESTRRYEEGSRTAARSLVAPFRIPPGTPCILTSSYSYKPTFSLSWHHVNVHPISFVTQEAEGE